MMNSSTNISHVLANRFYFLDRQYMNVAGDSEVNCTLED